MFIFQEKAVDANVPVIVFVEDMAASGGYWLACTGSEIYADSCSIVGSIGVISQAGWGTDFFGTDILTKNSTRSGTYIIRQLH